MCAAHSYMTCMAWDGFCWFVPASMFP